MKPYVLLCRVRIYENKIGLFYFEMNKLYSISECVNIFINSHDEADA